MSAQHTPGRLVGADKDGRFNPDHEWIASHDSATFATVAPLWLGDEVAALVVHAGNNFAIDVVEQRARRLVACWNVCEGIATEHIERHGLPDFAQKISDLNAQRDELLAALIALRGACASAGWLTNSAHITHMDDARAAIAKVEQR